MSIIDDIKSVAKTIQQAGNIELYQKILDLQGQALEVVEESSKLRDENRELKEKLQIKENLKHERNSYWLDSGGKQDGPFCSRCWDVDKNLVRLHPGGNPAYYHCPNCKAGSVLVKPELDPPVRTQRYYDDFR